MPGVDVFTEDLGCVLHRGGADKSFLRLEAADGALPGVLPEFHALPQTLSKETVVSIFIMFFPNVFIASILLDQPLALAIESKGGRGPVLF